MTSGHFYFIKDSFYEQLPDCKLMTNKGNDLEGVHGRPCHFCFEYENYYWMVPISSRIEKFERIYNDKIEKRGKCDGIRFGYVNGEKRAFLIQNTLPVTAKYIDSEYTIEKGSVPVTINEDLRKELNGLLRKVIRLYSRGINITFTDIEKIIELLSSDE